MVSQNVFSGKSSEESNNWSEWSYGEAYTLRDSVLYLNQTPNEWWEW